MAPVSRPASICMMVMPVSASPARIGWIGAAPRQRGSSEAWILGSRVRNIQHRLRQNQPVGNYHHQIGANRTQHLLRLGVFQRRRPATGSHRCSASCLTALGVSFMPRPAGRSGCVNTSAISCPAAINAASALAANSGVPAKSVSFLALQTMAMARCNQPYRPNSTIAADAPTQ